MFDLNQIKTLKEKGLILKTEKYSNTEGQVMVKFVVKQFDTMTGLQIQDGFLELSLTELRNEKAQCKAKIDQINDQINQLIIY